MFVMYFFAVGSGKHLGGKGGRRPGRTLNRVGTLGGCHCNRCTKKAVRKHYSEKKKKTFAELKKG